MTDNRIKKIRVEIEKAYEEAQERVKLVKDVYWEGKVDAYRNVLCVFDLMQEEPVSEFLNTESMIESYKQRLISQANGVKNSPLIDMCLASYKHGINETLDTLDLSNVQRTTKDCKEPASEKKCMFTKDSYTDEDRKVLCEDCKERCEYNKKEEPASDDEIEKQFKVGDIVVYTSRHPAYSGLYLLGNPNDLSIGYSNANEPYQIALRNCTIASEDERRQFMRELNDNGYKWNENTLRMDKKEKPVSEEWIEELRTKLASLSKEDFKKVFDKYAINFDEEPVSRTPADIEAAMQEVEEKSRVFTEAHHGEDADTILAQMRGEEPVSEDLEEASKEWLSSQLDKSYSNYGEAKMMELTHFDGYAMLDAIDFGAKWQKNHLWKSAEGPDLPIFDREVIVLLDNGKVAFAHRPNPEGWDAKSIITEKVERYIPETYGKGGWNIPNVKWWLDCNMPKVEED